MRFLAHPKIFVFWVSELFANNILRHFHKNIAKNMKNKFFRP